MLGSLLPAPCEQEKTSALGRDLRGEPPVWNPAAAHPFLLGGRMGKMPVQSLLAQDRENATKDPELWMLFFLLNLLWHFICYLMSF